jgi:hypothetical protein
MIIRQKCIISHLEDFYRDLYMLSEQVYNSIDRWCDDEFNCLPKQNQCTVIILAIGKLIAGHCTKLTCAEMADSPLINKSEYDSCNHFCSLSQDVIFDVLCSQYGVLVQSKMKITVADKVCVAGLVINKAPLHEYLLDLTGKSCGRDRQVLDASQAQ